MKFAVIGDFHFCNVPPLEMKGGSAVYDDRPRYRTITLREAPSFLDAVAAEKPDYVICTGDIVEGGLSNPRQALQEAKLCLAEFKKRNLQVLSTAGTHESETVMKKCIMPGNENSGIMRGPGNAFSFSREGVHFLFVDYRMFGENSSQRTWFTRLLEDIPNNEFISIVSHGPLFPVARPFFSEPDMITFIKQALKKKKADFFFCGHTHNQIISSHNMPFPMLQIKCSSIGFRAHTPLPLEQEQSILLKSGYHFGVPENCAPGFWIFNISGKKAEGIWHIPGHAFSARISKEHGEPAQIIEKPVFKTISPTPFDLALINYGRLNIYGWNIHGNEARLILNGRQLGILPANTSWAARRRYILAEEDLSRLANKNLLEITAIKKGDWALGGFCLAGSTIDERPWRSNLHKPVYIYGNKFTDNWGMPKGGVKLITGETKKIILTL